MELPELTRYVETEFENLLKAFNAPEEVLPKRGEISMDAFKRGFRFLHDKRDKLLAVVKEAAVLQGDGVVNEYAGIPDMYVVENRFRLNVTRALRELEKGNTDGNNEDRI